jgi:leucine dehydrogenase
VRLGIEAALEAVFGAAAPAQRTVLVEGLGAVGVPLARELAERGARLLLADLDGERAARLAAELGAEIVEPGVVGTTRCDVYAPCAVGGTLNETTIPRLACRIVAGSANNQLGTPEDAERLHRRGILYAPDFIINGAGALVFGTMDATTTEPPDKEALVAVGDRLREIFTLAREHDESTAAATRRLIGLDSA